MKGGDLKPRAPRLGMVVPVELSFRSVERPSHGVVVNVSTTGMLVRLSGPPARSEGVGFSFSRFRGTGDVVWVSSGEGGSTLMGLMFTSIGPVGDEAGKDTPGPTAPGPGLAASATSSEALELDFRRITDEFIRCGVTVNEIALELGVTSTIVRRARMESVSPNHLDPPDDWVERLAELARGRGDALDELARWMAAAG